ncbi:MAG: hypothetical protein IPM21_03015 [Acidobacteria bacterium]|nr:hypothetical protein [Acidobacteriota bacterium]
MIEEHRVDQVVNSLQIPYVSHSSFPDHLRISGTHPVIILRQCPTSAMSSYGQTAKICEGIAFEKGKPASA